MNADNSDKEIKAHSDMKWQKKKLKYWEMKADTLTDREMKADREQNEVCPCWKLTEEQKLIAVTVDAADRASYEGLLFSV